MTQAAEQTAQVVSGRGWTMHLGDCLDVVPGLARGAYVITDPPYGIEDAPMLDLPGRGGRGNGTYHAASEWDASIDPAWCEVVAAAAPVVAWFGHWRKRHEVTALMPHHIRAEIVWAKNTHVGPPCPLAMRDERIWIFGADGVVGQHFETTVWDEPIIPTWARREHKNEKPVALMIRLINWLTPPGSTVLDPFAGSGTTGVAALRSGRTFVGVEKDADHFATACARLRAEERNSTLAAAKAGQASLFPTPSRQQRTGDR